MHKRFSPLIDSGPLSGPLQWPISGPLTKSTDEGESIERLATRYTPYHDLHVVAKSGMSSASKGNKFR